MKRTFVEVDDFRLVIDSFEDEKLLETIQNDLLKDPERGDLVTGSGGIRKFRVALGNKGKRGGLRVFYLDISHKEICYLLFVLKKSESENITAAEKKELREIVQILKK